MKTNVATTENREKTDDEYETADNQLPDVFCFCYCLLCASFSTRSADYVILIGCLFLIFNNIYLYEKFFEWP